MLRKTCLLLIVLFLIPGISQAEVKTYTHTVRQVFGGSQSPDDARIGAIAKAKREVLEKAGTYLESMTIVRESVVEKDEILALAAGVLKSEIVSEKKFLEGNEFGIYVTAKVDVDTSILEERIRKLIKNHGLLEKYKDNQKRENELLARIKVLETENQKLKALPLKEQKQKKEILKNKFREATQGLTASELMNKALALWKNGKYTDPNKALEYLNQAISLDSNYTNAYSNRGVAWINKGDYDRAISDFDKTIELNPSHIDAYLNRGSAWKEKGDYDRAISDFDKTIELNPRDGDAYVNRGLSWKHKGNYDRAISDYTKAIELNPRDAGAYNGRGVAWIKKGDYDRAISDYTKAIELNPRDVDVYVNRGLTWNTKGNYDRAISDYTKAIELDPRNTDAYNSRGFVYMVNLGNKKKACSDWKKACDLGDCRNIKLAKRNGDCR
jgi:tetratricopeptide (TPR) repeat protein